MSRVIGYTPVFGPGCFSLSGLVVAGGVDGEFADDLSGGCVADGDLGVVDEHQDVFAGVGPPDADVAERSGVAEGEFPEPGPRGRCGGASRLLVLPRPVPPWVLLCRRLRACAGTGPGPPGRQRRYLQLGYDISLPV
jgi:hypothetical protein